MATKKLTTHFGIPYSELETMVKTYKAHAMKHPDYQAEKYHVKSIWFPIAQINDICQKLNDEGADGLRVYLGRYPADVNGFEDPKPEPNTNSVVFVSTGLDDDGNPAPKTDYFIDEVPMLPENRGEQCQPTCNGVLVNPPN